MTAARTSDSHPIRVDWLPTPWPGRIGLTFAPGKKQDDALTGRWNRDLESDLRRLREEFGAEHLVCLLEDRELDELDIRRLRPASERIGLALHRFPIPDGAIPGDLDALRALVGTVVGWANAGHNVVIHCKGGLGRAGTIGGCVLRAAGLSADASLEALVAARGPNCPETAAQRALVRRFSIRQDQVLPVSVVAPKNDRARGMLVGLAIGDAIGAPVEFDHPSRIAHDRGRLWTMPGGGGFGWAPGEFTDDTQMAIVLARHLVANAARVDQAALATEFADWARDAADVGSQTRQVLDDVRRGTGWRDAASLLPKDAEGNGSLMRVAPAALPASSAAAAAELARRQSEVTHPSLTCQDASALFARLLWTASETGELPALDDIATWASTDSVREAVLAARTPDDPPMSGWVLRTLTGALWAVEGASDFEDAIWRAVRLGHDADTVGAIAGSLAGTVHGLSGIPVTLSERLQSRHRLFMGAYPTTLIALADDLLALRQSTPGGA